MQLLYLILTPVKFLTHANSRQIPDPQQILNPFQPMPKISWSTLKFYKPAQPTRPNKNFWPAPLTYPSMNRRTHATHLTL